MSGLANAALTTDGVPGADRSARMVEASRALVAQVRSGGCLGSLEEAEAVVSGLVGMVASVEMSMNALAAQRSALMAVAAAVVEAQPATMVPMPRGAVATVADSDHAHRALVADLATASGASEATTATLVRTGTELVDHLPGLLTAMGVGALGDKHVRHVVRHAEGLPDGVKARYEADVLARLGADRSPAGVGRTARAARERCHPRTLTERHERASQDRGVDLDLTADGMAWLSAYLPAVQATAIFDKLTGVARALGPDEGEQRTLAQRRADVLTALVLDPPVGAPPGEAPGEPSRSESGDDSGSASSDRPPWALDPALHALRPTVAVTVPVMTLLGVSDEPGHLDGYGPIDPDTARALAANAPSFIRLLTHPETGVVLSVGRERYSVPADLRTWLRLRDEVCRFPGCRRPAGRAEIDHTVPFREDGNLGSTEAENLAHLCARHHRMKHTTRWVVRQEGRGRLTWTSPTGRAHTSEPGLELPGAFSAGAPSALAEPSAGAPSALAGEGSGTDLTAVVVPEVDGSAVAVPQPEKPPHEW